MDWMRIAFFGGSFDPPHAGHLRIAEAAAERLRLDRILLAPVALQPLKREARAPASYADRLAMLRLLLAEPRGSGVDMRVSERDGPRADGKPNYTFDTLVQLRAELNPADALFVLLGADSFLSLRHWHRAADLLPLAGWIVAARPGFSLNHRTELDQLAQFDEALPESFRPSGDPSSQGGLIAQRLAGADGQSTMLYLLPDLHEDVSATGIRQLLAKDGAAQLPGPANCDRQPLAPSVAAYIRAHGLYR
jgi:nicotinate-nucleotide adenylyltransferase